MAVEVNNVKTLTLFCWGPPAKASGKYGFGFSWDECIHTEVEFHFWVQGQDRLWGLQFGWWDGPLNSFGLGPFLLVCWRY